jgi:plasmid stabilization system protein ParE
MAVRAAPDANTIITPSSDQSRGTITDRMELSRYEALIQERLRANADRAREFEDAWYRDVPLRAEPPEYGRLIKRHGIQPQYTFLSPSEPARWFEPDTNQPVVFRVNPVRCRIPR